MINVAFIWVAAAVVDSITFRLCSAQSPELSNLSHYHSSGRPNIRSASASHCCCCCGRLIRHDCILASVRRTAAAPCWHHLPVDRSTLTHTFQPVQHCHCFNDKCSSQNAFITTLPIEPSFAEVFDLAAGVERGLQNCQFLGYLLHLSNAEPLHGEYLRTCFIWKRSTLSRSFLQNYFNSSLIYSQLCCLVLDLFLWTNIESFNFTVVLRSDWWLAPTLTRKVLNYCYLHGY